MYGWIHEEDSRGRALRTSTTIFLALAYWKLIYTPNHLLFIPLTMAVNISTNSWYSVELLEATSSPCSSWGKTHWSSTENAVLINSRPFQFLLITRQEMAVKGEHLLLLWFQKCCLMKRTFTSMWPNWVLVSVIPNVTNQDDDDSGSWDGSRFEPLEHPHPRRTRGELRLEHSWKHFHHSYFFPFKIRTEEAHRMSLLGTFCSPDVGSICWLSMCRPMACSHDVTCEGPWVGHALPGYRWRS